MSDTAYKWKFNSGLTVAQINNQIRTWTKGGEVEKIKAHEFVVSLCLRYVEHGNYDEVMHVADAIGHKFTKHARTAFIEWLVTNTSLGYNPAARYETRADIENKTGKMSGEGGLIHVKGQERTFNERAAIWDTSKAKHDSGANEFNQSFWTYIKKEQKPFDYSKAVKQLLQRAVNEHVDLGQAKIEFAKAMEAAERAAAELCVKEKAEAMVKAELEKLAKPELERAPAK